MKVTMRLTVEIEVETTGHEREQASADAVNETENALDYWFSHTDRKMTARSVTLKG